MLREPICSTSATSSTLLDFSGVHHLGDDRQPVCAFASASSASPSAPRPWNAYGSCGACRRRRGAACRRRRDGDRGLEQLLARLDRARPGDQRELLAADRRLADLESLPCVLVLWRSSCWSFRRKRREGGRGRHLRRSRARRRPLRSRAEGGSRVERLAKSPGVPAAAGEVRRDAAAGGHREGLYQRGRRIPSVVDLTRLQSGSNTPRTLSRGCPPGPRRTSRSRRPSRPSPASRPLSRAIFRPGPTPGARRGRQRRRPRPDRPPAKTPR